MPAMDVGSSTQSSTTGTGSTPSRRPIEDAKVRAQALVPVRPWGRRVVGVLLGLGVVGGLLLWRVPWQQTVVANGRVSVWSVMDRPQTVEALLGGRLAYWKVQEGQDVRRGQRLGLLEDTDAKFLDPERVERVRRQRDAQVRRRAQELGRANDLESQIAELRRSQGAQLPSAGERIEQAKRRRDAAMRAVAIARKNLEIARDIARLQAAERVRKAAISLEQASQAETSARQDFDTETLRRQRIARLFADGLRSRQDDEFAERDLVARRVRWEQAKQSVEGSKRDVAIAEKAGEQVALEVQRAQETVLQAQAAADVAARDIDVAGFDRARIGADTSGAIHVAEANLQSVKATVATIDDTIAKLDLELANMTGRVRQQEIVAPVDGRVVRVGPTVGPGQTVKAGDMLVVIAPDRSDPAVELTVRGADAPLVSPGRKVRLQFNGFPAVQISGFPQAAVGTFGGVVETMDRIDDGTGNVRVWVRPDAAWIREGRDKAWPSADLLRPGTDAVAWVMLDTVPLGYELWRQFNAFPPNFRIVESGSKDDDKSNGENGGKDAKGKPAVKPDIKLPKR